MISKVLMNFCLILFNLVDQKAVEILFFDGICTEIVQELGF